MLLEKRVAIITGGTKGIGKGIALKFASEGCDVVVTARHIEDAREVADKIKASGRKSLAVKADVSRRAEVDALVAQTLEQFSKIDILVNNAGGISRPKDTSIEDTSEEDWDRIVDINLKGQFLCCRAVVPSMKKAHYGKIINVSSMGAIHPPASIIHYHAAKGGVLSLTRDLAFDLAPFNITVNAILPGPIKTEFFNEMLKAMSKEEGETFFAMLGKRVPLGRMGTPDEVAGVALFLASELSSYVTGEAICVGGGLPLSPKDS
jgi:NAD(P)-dependent dehydrogenase (short-subunit alcohol dehydrogenase family)